MLRKTLFMLVLVAAPALAQQQPANTPVKARATSSDTTKAKGHHRRHAAAAKAKGAAAHTDSAAHRDTTSRH
jgi:hypothetical protein